MWYMGIEMGLFSGEHLMSDTKRRGKNTSDREKGIIANIFEWLWLAVERQKHHLPVFEGTLNKVRIASQVLGVSRATVYRSLQAKPENPSKGGRPGLYLINSMSLVLLV